MLLPGNESSCWADLLRSNRSVPGGPEPGGPEPGGPEPEAVGGPGPEAVVVPAVFGLIFVVGVVGNCLVMVVIGKVRHLGAGGGGGRRVLSPTNVFVLNLSVADLSFLLCCVPLHATVYSLPEWLFGSFLCWFGHFFSSVTMLVSIFTLVAMSVDRYVAVVRSNKSACVRSRRNALSGLCAIWTLSLLCSVPVAQHQVLTSHPTAPNSTFCWENWAGASRRAYRVTVLLLGFLLPLLLISCCYFRVLFHLHKKMKNMSKKSERSKRKVMMHSLTDGPDGPPGGHRLRCLLDAASHHRHVGGVRFLPADRRLLRLPHRVPLSVLRELLRQPRPLRLPVRELPEGLLPGVHLLPELATAAAQWEGGPVPPGHILQHTLHHQHLNRWSHDYRSACDWLLLHL
ncbi:galanin receptor type 1b isoform X2 [Amphiprion ocellaris]|uniref:G-protein coupled receptors family 1 profile domain-containing protein n=1 Tax=Amphiprion ocellaris TaxID=80972 RepID=A0AAQ5X1J1_AMPOC|nr:galanin receptor type 1b isoform X2 [Amphiprion ocellaris]